VNAAESVDRSLRLNATVGQAADRNHRPIESIRAREPAHAHGDG